MIWLKTREQFLIRWLPWDIIEESWVQMMRSIKPGLACDWVSRLWQRKVYWPEQAGPRNPCHGVKITFEEQCETIRRCLVMRDILCIFKRTPCLLSGEWIGVQHAVRRVYAIVQVRDWSKLTMAAVKNSAWVEIFLGALHENLLLDGLWEMREVIKVDIQVSSFETKWMTMLTHLLEN